MESIEETLDLTNVIPKGVSFKIDKNEYILIYTFSALKRLGDIYGNVKLAIEALEKNEDPYSVVLNFLYSGLYDRYQLSKQKIENWIGTGSVNLFYNLIFSAVLLSFGKSDGDEGIEDAAPGEV